MEENTYIDSEGFVRCSKCHHKKQDKLVYKGKEYHVNLVCLCDRELMEAEENESKAAELKRRADELRKQGFYDKNLMQSTFENDDGSQEKVIHNAKKYVENFAKYRDAGKGLLLYGGVGTGKTYIAACIANALINTGIPVMFTNFSRIANKMQERFGKAQEFLDSLDKYQLLVIDDLATERSTEYMREIIFNVIDARYRSGLPMIITTNLSIESMSNAADISETRVYDRILEVCFPIEVNGESHRRKKIRADYAKMKKELEAD